MTGAKFVIAKYWGSWVLETPPDASVSGWRVYFGSFEEAVAGMDKWIRGRRRGVSEAELFRRIAL